MRLKGSKVLITGGAGFIGSHLTDQLSRLGCSIVVCDNMSKGRLENIRDPMLQGNVKLIRGDIGRYETAEHAVKDVEYVFHAAAIVELRNPMVTDSLVHEANVTGTLNLLLASLRSHIRRFVYLSSAAVYGEPSSLPVSEEAQTNPLSFYGVSKLAGEQYCKFFNDEYSLATITLRLFNVYGARQSHGPYAGVITGFVDSLLANKRPIVFGNGLQRRDFIHVSDVVSSIVAAASSKPDMNGEVFNIGTGNSITIRRLARILADICGKSLAPKYTKPRHGDIRRSCADVRRADSSLGFHCKVSLEEGLVDYVRSRARKP